MEINSTNYTHLDTMSDDQGQGRARGRARGKPKTPEDIRAMLSSRKPGDSSSSSSTPRAASGVFADKTTPAAHVPTSGRAYHR